PATPDSALPRIDRFFALAQPDLHRSFGDGYRLSHEAAIILRISRVEPLGRIVGVENARLEITPAQAGGLAARRQRNINVERLILTQSGGEEAGDKDHGSSRVGQKLVDVLDTFVLQLFLQHVAVFTLGGAAARVIQTDDKANASNRLLIDLAEIGDVPYGFYF